MTEQFRIVKVSYSEELSSESELWFRRFVEKALLDYIVKDDYNLRALLISERYYLEREIIMEEKNLIVIYGRVSSAAQSLELQLTAAQRHLESEK
ncbi:hypothetical protein I7V34_19945 [Bacillus sp. V3]|nr:hypothetical protein I7V34_19945 [Bacillus sp. V3]